MLVWATFRILKIILWWSKRRSGPLVNIERRFGETEKNFGKIRSLCPPDIPFIEYNRMNKVCKWLRWEKDGF